MSLRIPLLVPRTGHPYVPVVIRWKEAGTAIESAFVVDTGAPDLLLSQHDAESLGARLTELPLSRRTLSGLGGCARAFEMRDLEFVFFSEDGQPALFRRGLVNVAENPKPKAPGDRPVVLPSLLERAFIEEHRFCLYLEFHNGIGYLEAEREHI